MFSVFLFEFAKKTNSTKLPDMSDGYVYSCELKDGTDFLQPVIAFNFGEDEQTGSAINPTNYTYARIPEFKRYYYIENWAWSEGLWIATLKVDTLASYKTQIGDAELYVLRSAARGDSRVIDTKYPAIATLDNQIDSMTGSPWSINLESPDTTNGFFLVGIINNDINAVGATAYYAFSGAAMRAFINKLYDSPAWTNITDVNISSDLQKLVLNPIQYVTSVIWIPYGLSSYAQADVVTTLPVGWWSITLTQSAIRIGADNQQTQFVLNLPVPKHPQAQVGYSKEWLNMSPYLQYALEFYPFGMIPIDASKLCGADNIQLQVKLDYITGIGTLRIKKWLAGSNAPYGGAIYATTAQVGIPLSLGQMSVDLSKLGNASKWSAAIGLGASSSEMFPTAFKQITGGDYDLGSAAKEYGKATLDAAKWAYQIAPHDRDAWSKATIDRYHVAQERVGRVGGITQEVKQAGADIISGVIAATGVCESQGATGAFAQYTIPIYFTAYYSRIVETDVVNNGIPLCEKVKINTLGGFTLVANADALELMAMPVEKRIVQAYLEGGFYYE